MKIILNYLKDIYSGPVQAVLVFSFTLVAALTIGIGNWVITNTITSYLAEAMDERIEQDFLTAELFYQFRLEDLARTANQLAISKTVRNSFAEAREGNASAIRDLESKIETALSDCMLKGNRVVVVLDDQGNLVAGVLRSIDQQLSLLQAGRSWSGFTVIDDVQRTGVLISATEVIPKEILVETGLDDQARIELLDTPKAAPEPFDPREGTAGLGIVGVAPIQEDDLTIGTVAIFHLFNNDFTLVDAIKDSAKIDTATIFFGDLRVSTNVMTEQEERAVGTRVSQDVNEVVLQNGLEYVGTAFVVNEDYITRYEPLLDHQDQTVGILYVGSRQKVFLDFLSTFRNRTFLVAVITILMTFLITTPVSRKITRPLQELRTLSQISQLVAEGDLQARAPSCGGGAVGLLADSFNDMLDRLQETQEKLVESEKLASLGQLAAGVAHELNNPLATVLLFAEVLLRDNKFNDLHQTDLRTIVRETERCKTIVSSLLDFARQHQVDAAEINLNHLTRRVIELEKNQHRYDRVEIELNLDPQLPRIQADEAQIQAVISNLMTNAADAMPEGGKLIIRTRRAKDDQIIFEVEDEGEGITTENQARLFTPFFTTKPLGKGVGLGLSIVYGIIKMHRGQISVQSKLSEGTTFTVQLPVRQPETDLLISQDEGVIGDETLIG
ncbi:MAG: cache domain-containing protein [Anaerolineales bacterium]|nr:cache domain-containing protein [Anaerolineales bacterium]